MKKKIDKKIICVNLCQSVSKKGFTLIEILTTIAVIAILLGFLIPALSTIEKTALNVRQKAQFHGIEVALEAFSTDMGYYPPSAWGVPTYGTYSASQRLAEALIGQDGFGFHPSSQFRGDGTVDGTAATALYVPATMDVRKGPYLDLENANAVKLSNLYYGTLNYGTLVDSYVLVDKYKITKNAATGKMTGSPILYYKANTNEMQHHLNYAFANPSMNDCTYNVYDSIGYPTGDKGIASLKSLLTKTGVHPLSVLDLTGAQRFYDMTANPNFPGDPTYPAVGTQPPRPYRASTFILHSAGPDGLYGTTDDVFNFEKEE